MSVMYLRGGAPLEGSLAVHGAKNSVLPILAACLLAREPVTLHNCPRLTDVTAALGIAVVMAVGRGMDGFVNRQTDMAGDRHFIETRQHIKGAVDCQWHHR